MPPRHPPRLWLMTDERMGDSLWLALERLPRGAGVVFRHYSLPPTERRALFLHIRAVARRRHLMLVRAGETAMPGEAGMHGAQGRMRRRGLQTAPVHSRREALAAIRAGAELLFVSPVFATRSHAGAPALGRARFGFLIRNLGVPVVALGGMNAQHARSLVPFGIYGWAAIDAWIADRRPSGPTVRAQSKAA